MGQGHSLVGFVVIEILYLVVGLLAAAGTISITRKLAPKIEQIVYAILLVMIALLYLAFAAYFGATSEWRLETAAVVAFVAISLLGVRLPSALILGYALHGLWDFVHELQAHGAWSAFEPGQLTAIPLAYGIFCLAVDFFLAAYFYSRRSAWSAAWKSSPQ